MLQPDYRQGSIVNLMATLRTAFGRHVDYAPLPVLAPESLAGRRLLLIIADGVGYRQVANRPGSVLARHLKTRLTSVFPTTTATAITSFFTASAPQQHGISGWFTWFRELGSVAAVLPFMPRSGGPPYSSLSPAQLIGRASLFDDLPGTSEVYNPAHINDSIYSRTCSGNATRHAYGNLEELFRQLAGLPHTPGLSIAYWPEFDGLSHLHGVDSPQAQAALARFDALLGKLLERLAGSGITVLISADHGMLDTAPERVIHLETHPELAADLVLPLCGEPRTAWCYVHPRRAAHFRDYVGTHLSHACELRTGEQLIEEGWFGLGSVHPELFHRVGDFALLMKENYVISQQLPGELRFNQVGVHGGAGAEEMEVPLVLIET